MHFGSIRKNREHVADSAESPEQATLRDRLETLYSGALYSLSVLFAIALLFVKIQTNLGADSGQWLAPSPCGCSTIAEGCCPATRPG